MRAKPTRTYVTASAQTWELIRAAYLAGLSAPACAARFGVGVPAIRKRAGREGWTKTAHALARTPEARDVARRIDERNAALTGGGGHIEAGELSRLALKHAARCLREGRPYEARACAAAAEAILKLDEAAPFSDIEPEAESEDQIAARQTIINDAIWEQAMLLTEALRQGRPLPERFTDAARRWGWSLDGAAGAA